MRSTCSIALTCGILVIAGCGRSVAPPEGDPVQLFADEVRAAIESLRDSLAGGEGVTSVRSGVDGAIENVAIYESRAVGTHKATYEAIVNGLKELKGQLAAGKASKEDVKTMLDGLVGLTDTLPKAQSQ